MYLQRGSLHGALEVLAADFADDVLGCGILEEDILESRRKGS
jgi:hypothetical protein